MAVKRRALVKIIFLHFRPGCYTELLASDLWTGSFSQFMHLNLNGTGRSCRTGRGACGRCYVDM